MLQVQERHELQVPLGLCTKDGSQLAFQRRCLDPQVQPAVISGAPYPRRAARRDDAGLARIDFNRLAANGRVAPSTQRKPQPGKIELRIIRSYGPVAGRKQQHEVLQRQQTAARLEGVESGNLDPGCAEPCHGRIPELFGIRGAEDRRAVQRIGWLSKRHDQSAEVAPIRSGKKLIRPSQSTDILARVS